MKTVESEFLTETEEKRSRFLCYLVPYASFAERLSELRKEHPKANHHVIAFRYVDEDDRIIEGAKDDGEPSGTSGPPALKVLQGNDLMDIGAIIVRYFGGTKLGTGGLARAYAGAVSAALSEAVLVPWVQIDCCNLSIEFTEISRCERAASTAGISVIEREYTAAGIDMTFSGERKALQKFLENWQSYD